MLRCTRALGLVLVALATASPALAQDAFPSRTIRLVVSFPPGGSARAYRACNFFAASR